VHSTQQFFYCFGCGESGDVFSFMMKYHNLDFPTALKRLAERCNVELPEKSQSLEEKRQEAQRRRMREVTEKAAAIYRRYLREAKEAEVARRYLAGRGIPVEIQERFGIGYAPSKDIAGWDFLVKHCSEEEAIVAEQVGLLVKNDRGGRFDRFRDRVLFPLFDIHNRMCGFGGRIVGEGQPKYMNSPESAIFNKGRTLLGLLQQGKEIRLRNKVVIVEGNFDMISMVVHGCANVVAPLGTALTSSQVRILTTYAQEAVLLFDGDEAGVKAAVRAAPHFLAEKMRARVALLPEGHDPDTFIREKGAAEMGELVEGAVELPEFVLNQLIREHGLSLEGKTMIVEKLKPLVAAAASPLQRSVVIAHFGEKLGVTASQLEDSLRHENVAVAGEPPAVIRPRQSHQLQGDPLTSAEKRLLEFMVLHPGHFFKLEEAGIRECLQGGIGEIVFLQMKMMLQGGGDVQPEEILSALPEGPERSLVAGLLFNASLLGVSEGEGEQSQARLDELLEWLAIKQMRKRSDELSALIADAQRREDFSQLAQLYQEKQIIERAMRKFRE
jgi:DNA primase